MFRTLQMFTISNIIHRTFVLGCKFMLVIYVPPITYPKVTVNELWDRWNVYSDFGIGGTLFIVNSLQNIRIGGTLVRYLNKI